MPMRWRKLPQALVHTFSRLVPDAPGVERRRMFGYPCAFVNGNMFMGLFEESLFLRLPEDARAAFLKSPGAAVFEPMSGRKMREYVIVPTELIATPACLPKWVDSSLAYAGSLPAKAPKTVKKTASRRRA
jgi:TfoX/Sxy family transcriptional regulator of competence genes